MMSKTTIALTVSVALLLTAGGLLSAPAQAGEPAALPFTSWEKALEEAKRDNRPVFVHFTASWCKPCKQLMDEVYPQAAIQKRLVDFARAEVDTEVGSGKELWLKLKADSLPVAAVFSAAGEELPGTRIVGMKKAEEIIAVLDDALERGQQALPDSEVAADKLKEAAKDRAQREKVRGGEWQTRDTSWLGTAVIVMVAVLFGLIGLFIILKVRRERRLKR